MLGRRLLCFQSNIDRLSKHGRCYLWTFTRLEAEDFLTTRAEWNKLLTYLRRSLPAWAGVRVYEVHPGKWGEFSHGLHVHAITNKFHDVNEVRQACKTAGWGRCHVVRCRKGSEYYIGKYLRKQRPESLRGWRLHATFGLQTRTRLADIVCEGVRASLMRYICRAAPGLGWCEKLGQVRALHHRYIQGRFSLGVLRALSGHRYSGIFRRWVERSAVSRNVDLNSWGFHPRQSPSVLPVFNPHATCWGIDLRKADYVANRAAALVSR